MVNSVDSDETTRYDPSHLELNICKSTCQCLQGLKGLMILFIISNCKK